MLFTSDDDLRQMQRRSAKQNGVVLTEADIRRERIEDDRELREHQRWRQFAFLLFVVPAIFTIISIVGGWIAVHLAMASLPTSSPFSP